VGLHAERKETRRERERERERPESRQLEERQN
jgi:hypothetical protein